MEYKIPEVRARMYLQEVSALYSVDPITNSSGAAEVLRKNFEDADREYMVSVNLDVQGRPISFHVAGIGSLNEVNFNISSVFKIALLQNATSVILCHNHPGGTVYASPEDQQSTIDMVRIGKLLGVRVLDHFILTPTDYMSMRETYPEVFD